MSSNGVPSSEYDLNLQYREMFLESQQEEQRGRDNNDHDYQDNDEEEMEDEEEEETTTSCAGGSETSSQARAGRQRRPNKVGSGREKFTEVDADGMPQKPIDLAKGYNLQVAAILREVTNFNEVNIRAKNKEGLHVQLISRLHARYEFPEPCSNQDLKGNIVNTHAITKFSKAPSGYKTQVRGMIKDGATSADIREHYPKIT